LNYLHRQGRLVEFTNLGTVLPARNEYEDYLRWCSSFFNDLVRYNSEVVSVSPESKGAGGSVKSFTVQARDVNTGRIESYRGRNVLLATGGQPALPKSFPVKHPRVIHSSQYAHLVPKMLPKSSAPYKVVVVGAGQSAAEIFSNIQTLYPNSKTWLVMRQEFLKPSDDSPFVNSVFNPEFVDNLYTRSPRSRQGFLSEVRATNYGVVRLELIEKLYEHMYDQMRDLGRDETKWPHRIMATRQITSVEPHGESVEVKVQRIAHDNAFEDYVDIADEEAIEADLVIAATGYQRSAHVDMLKDTWNMLPKAAPSTGEYKKGISGWNVATEAGERKMAVGRDYRVKYMPGTISDDSGIWLQGLCEGTHGVSDSLLSVIATRSGEIVNSIFGENKH
jgi:L-ornithine N5-oxygenase